MSSLEVVFNVPEQIALGLETGTLQRIGGVIVERTSKQVVAWLRDGTVQRAADSDALSSSFLHILTAAGKQANIVTALTMFTAGGQVLNLAMAAVSFRQILQKLDRLSEEIQGLGGIISDEFANDRDMRFRVALQAARDVFEGANLDNRDNAMRSAVDGLYAARENFLTEFKRLLEQPNTDPILLTAQHMLMRAMYAEVSRIRCYLASEEVELAKRRLSEDLPQFRQYARVLVLRWLSETPAIYFHKMIETQALERFLHLQQWLYVDNVFGEINQATLLFQIIDEMRADFWNMDLVQDEYGPYILNQITRRPVKTFADRASQLTQHLDYAEVVAENFDRLLGFDLEIRSFRLASEQDSFSEWSHRVTEDDLKNHDIGIIVDQERLASMSA